MRTEQKTWWCLGIAIAAAVAQAQVPPDIAKTLVAIGRGVCVPEHQSVSAAAPNPHKGVALPDISSADLKMSSTYFRQRKAAAVARADYVRGARQTARRTERRRLYDNIMLWAVKERHDRRQHAAPSRGGVGRSSKSGRDGGQWVGKNISLQRKSGSRFHVPSPPESPASLRRASSSMAPRESASKARFTCRRRDSIFFRPRPLQVQADLELAMIRALLRELLPLLLLLRVADLVHRRATEKLPTAKAEDAARAVRLSRMQPRSWLDRICQA